ncbi:MAG: hypothetical protein RI894_2141 [Bacteroidota bacterium]|jgi:hypothetical protein
MKNPLFIGAFIVLTLAACQPTKRSMQQTAADFLTALDKKEYSKAKKLGTENTRSILQLLQELERLTPLKPNAENHSTIDTKKIDCKKTGDKAICDYCCNQAGAPDKLELVNIDGKWLVDMKKDMGSNGLPPPPPNEDSPYTPQEADPDEVAKIDAARRGDAPENLPSIEKTAEGFLQALDDRSYADAVEYSGDSLNKVLSNISTAEFALLSEDDKNKDAPPPSQNTNYAVGCKEDTASGNMICVCTNFKTKAKTTLTIAHDDETSPWKVIRIAGRNDIATIDQTKKESVAANFAVSLLNRDFAKATTLATPISAKAIDFVARHSARAKMDTWDVGYYDNLLKIKCQLSANGATATCPYCCNGEGNDDVLELVKIGDKWFVNFEIK